MSKNITLMGASYSAVPAVELPVTGGGTATFTDVTDTTATAADVAEGKKFYLASGAAATGTASGGGGGEKYPIMDDGKTYLYISILTEKTLPLRFSNSTAGGVTIDWGDGSAVETVSTSGITTCTHTYATEGEYTVVLDVLAGTIAYGGDRTRILIYNATSSASSTPTTTNAPWRTMLRAVEFGSHGLTSNTMGAYALYCFAALELVVFPRGLSGLGMQFAGYCYALKKVRFLGNSTVSFANTNPFYYCYTLETIDFGDIAAGSTIATSFLGGYLYALREFVYPEGATSITGSATRVYALETVTFPSTMQSIYTPTNANAPALREVHFKSEVPPALTGTWAPPSGTVLYVPAGSLEAYTTAENYPDPATYTYIEE